MLFSGSLVIRGLLFERGVEVDGEEVSLELEDEEDEKGWSVLTKSLLLLYLTALVAT